MTGHSFAIPGPETITTATLDNGLRVLVRENPSAPIAVLEGYLVTGSVNDPAALCGVGSFVAEMLTRGSEGFGYDLFNDTVESIGATLSITGDTHTTSLSVAGLSEDFPQLLTLLADAVRRPLFAADQLELVRAQTLVYHQERAQDTHHVAGMRFYETMYGDHPYGRPVTGYPESAAQITREDLTHFYTRTYSPANAILVVSGDLQAAHVVELLADRFGDWKGSRAQSTLAAPIYAAAASRHLFPMADKYQSDVVMGCPAIGRHHPDYYALRVANTILGRFGMMGRLGERVREQMGLAYYCYSAHDAELLGGVWQAIAGVNPAHVPQVIDAILSEFERLAAEPPSAAELADSQAYLTGVVPLTLETNEGAAATLLNMAWYDLGLDYLQRYDGLINAVTPADVQRVAATYLRADRCVTSVAGPEVA